MCLWAEEIWRAQLEGSCNFLIISHIELQILLLTNDSHFIGVRSALSINIFKLIFFFLAALGLHCCVQAFSSRGKWGLLSAVVQGLLTALASLAVDHGSRCKGFSNCGTWSQ